jgi:hypothetical protein
MEYKVSDARFSMWGSFRYNLLRVWDESLPKACFIGLNPSTANATTDDPTIRRCAGFARAWGYGGLWMGNLFAYVSTDPKKLILGAESPSEADNLVALEEIVSKSALTVAAWGAWKLPYIKERARVVTNMFPQMQCLGKTKDGSPRHPLYLKADTKLIPMAEEVKCPA